MLTSPITNKSKQLTTYDLEFCGREKQILWEDLLQHVIIRMTLLDLGYNPVIIFFYFAPVL